MLGRADARHHVLALGVGQELGVEAPLARAGVAGEADARPRRLAEIAEDHRHHGDRRAPVGGDAVDAPVLHRLLGEPRLEDGVDGQPELLARILGEGRPRPFGHQVLVGLGRARAARRPAPRDRSHAEPPLDRRQVLLEYLALDVEHHVAEHRDEASVAIPGEARVAGAGGQALDRLVVETEVEHGLHHAGHGDTRARSGPRRARDGRGRRSAHCVIASSLPEALEDLVPQPVRIPPPSRLYSAQASVVIVKPGGTGMPRLVISASSQPFAPEEVAHQG